MQEPLACINPIGIGRCTVTRCDRCEILTDLHACSETLADFARSDSRPKCCLTRDAAAASVTTDVKGAAPLRLNQVKSLNMIGTLSPCKTCVHTQHARLLPRRKPVYNASIACRASSQHKYKGTSDSRCTTSTGHDCQHPTEGIVLYRVLDTVLCLRYLICCVICAATSLTRRRTLQALVAAAVAVALPVGAVSAAESADNPTADVQVVMRLPSSWSSVHAC